MCSSHSISAIACSASILPQYLPEVRRRNKAAKPQFRSRAAVEKVEELLNRPKLTQVAENWKTGSLLIQ
jgi:hypothetical protein